MVVRVISNANDGVLVQASVASAKTYFLPWIEWDRDEDICERASFLIAPGDEVEVVHIGGETVEGLQTVSRKALQLEDVPAKWRLQPRTVQIEGLTRRIARGRIGEVPAVIHLQEYYDFLSSKHIPQNLGDHAYLAKGDRITGLVTELRNEFNSITVSISQYLQLRAEEVKHECKVLSKQPADEVEDPVDTALARLPEHLIPKISPMLLVENDLKCRDALTEILKESGVVVFSAETADSAAILFEHTNDPRIQLAIIDSNLSDDLDDHAGVELARFLNLKKCPVLLMTGEKSETKRSIGKTLKVNGYLQKPFTLQVLFDSIESAVNAEDSYLSDWIELEDSAEPNSESQTVVPRDEISAAQILQDIHGLCPNGTLHVFRIHKRSFRAESLQHKGEGLRWEGYRGKVEKSRIKDSAFSDAVIFEPPTHSAALHRWTLKMASYQFFLGARIPVEIGDFHYVLVGFYRTSQFPDTFLQEVQLAVERLARVFQFEQLVHQSQETQSFATIGMCLLSLAHELSTDLVSLSATASLLRAELECVEARHSKAGERSGKLASGLISAVGKAKALLGVRSKHESVSVLKSLNRSIHACLSLRHEYLKEPKNVQVLVSTGNLTDDDEVSAIPAALIILFFNILLNALQQIVLCRSLRRYGSIKINCRKEEDRALGSWAIVTIQDSGPGIHRESWDKIFRPGFTTKPSGTGLGLAICKNLSREISRAGTSAQILLLESAIWDGSTFQVRLPLLSKK